MRRGLYEYCRSYHQHVQCNKSSRWISDSSNSIGASIGDLACLDYLQWLIDHLVTYRYRGYTREIRNVRESKQIQGLGKYYDSLALFIESQKKYFELNSSKTSVRIRFSKNFQLSSDSLLAALKGLIPFWGSIKLESLAAILNDSNVQDVFSLLHEDTVMDEYVPIRNSQGKVFIYHKVNSDIVAKGFSVGDNKCVISVLKAADLLMPTVPSYFVPFEKCASNLRKQDLAVVRTISVRRISSILDGDLECAYFKDWDEIFLRRASSPKRTSLPYCNFVYEGYNVIFNKAVKLAFCLPLEPAPVSDIQVNLFPSLTKWGLQYSVYSPYDIVGMFPGVMLALPDGRVKSLVRGRYPELAPVFDQQATECEESIFDEKLQSEKYKKQCIDLFDHTSKQAGNFYVLNAHMRCERRKDGTIYLRSRETASLSDQEIMEKISKHLGEHDALPLEELTANIRKTASVEEQEKFRQAIYSRHGRSLVRLIRKNPRHKIVLTQERKTGSHAYHYIIKRAMGNELEQENPFLEENQLLSEVLFQIRHRSSLDLDGNDGVSIQAAQQNLPEKAREALRKSGGMGNFLACFPEIFEVTENFVKIL